MLSANTSLEAKSDKKRPVLFICKQQVLSRCACAQAGRRFSGHGHVMRKPSLFICEQQCSESATRMRKLISAFLVRSLDSTFIFVFTFLCVESYEVKSQALDVWTDFFLFHHFLFLFIFTCSVSPASLPCH